MSNKARRIFIATQMVLAIMFMSSLAFAGEIDILVQKLVDKGILTPGEAQQVVAETKEEVKKKTIKGENESLPQWLQTMKLKGDFRLRFEQQMTPGEGTATQDRHRGRYRLRLGLESKVNDQLKIGLRLASSEGEQTSTNQTFKGGFNGKDIVIDQVYAEYAVPLKKTDLKLIGGKIPNPFYATDLMWDGDVNPEGVAFKIEKPITENMKFFSNGAVFFLYESSSSYDEPTIFGIQGGLSGKFIGREYKTGLTYYDFHNFNGTGLTVATIFPGKQVNTNTLSSSQYVYDYNIVDFNAEYNLLTIDLFGKVLPLKLYGNYLKNIASAVKYDTGWMIGFQLGKAKEKGDWDFSYNYRVLQADAMIAELVDSDFHTGGTNARGHKFGLNYMLMKNTSLGLTFFNTWQNAGAKNYKNILQVDLNFKF
ncbi:MAG: putative porin [Candidatus Omnitrophica bacterium]|nr:putative porin [Candidatus Omnitrophota bacterium]